MKRKLATVFLAMLLLICTAVGLTACKDKTCEHSYSEWTESKAATCTGNGEETRTCAKCGNTETRSTEALGHDFSEEWTNDESGHWHACKNTGCNAKSNEDEHSDHDHYCYYCGYKTSEHDYTAIEYNWMGNDYCEAVRTCVKCSADAEGHVEKAIATVTPLVTQNKTCELPELTKYTATFAEDWAETQTKENVETEAAIGHEYAKTGTTDENGHYHLCIHGNCGAKSTYAETDKNNDYACDLCGENLSVKLKADLAALVGDGTNDNVTVTLNLNKKVDATIFEAIVEGLENAKDGSVNLTINGAETIPEKSFNSCDALGSVTLGEGVKTIDKNAFKDACYMTSLIIGDDVTDIAEYAFVGCYGLVNVTFGKKVENIGEGAFEFTAIESIVLPESVKAIGTYTFGYCSSLTEIVLSQNIETIPTSAFYATAIKTITIPDGVKTLETQALEGCSKLESIVIPDGVTSIGEQLFTGDSSLKSITFGKGVTKLSDNIFFYCLSLTEITFLSPITEATSKVFYDATAYLPEVNNLQTQNVTLNFAKGQKVLEQNSDGKWVATETNFSDREMFCGSMFKKINSYTEEIIATNMAADDLKTKLSTLVTDGETRFSLILAKDANSEMFTAISKGLENAKDGSVNLTINGAETIPSNAFAEHQKLKSVTLGDGVKSIESYAFYKCENLLVVTLGAGVKNIGFTAFSECCICEVVNNSSLTIEIGSSSCGQVARYAKSVHSGESRLKEWNDYLVICADDGDMLVRYVGKETQIVLPDKFKKDTYTIASSAFEYSNITSITIPASVTEIGKRAFGWSRSLTTVIFTENSVIDSIDEQVFYTLRKT